MNNNKKWQVELDDGGFKTIAKVRPVGALQARKQVSGAISFVWRYSMGNLSERVPIGIFDSAAPPRTLTPTVTGYSLAAAIRAAETMAVEHYQNRHAGGRPALLAANREAEQTATEERRRAASNTLRNLLNDYCDHLKALGRPAHSDARCIFNLHVFDAWPQYAAMPAKQVEGEHFADMMRKLFDAGKGRTANKLRSYARAAFQMAKAAKSKPSIPVSFKAYGITSNCVAETEPDETENRADKNPLTANELRVYWQLIQNLPGFKGALLRLHLLSGGQRMEQLVRLRTADIRTNSMLLLDGKGRPGRPPRTNPIPITEPIRAALEDCKPDHTFALSTDGGRTHVAATTLSTWACSAAEDYVVDFKAKRIRSGVETLLAAAGISQELRGRLQSHGISGVQARSYDGYDYLPEKRRALDTLYEVLALPGKRSPTPRRRVPKTNNR